MTSSIKSGVPVLLLLASLCATGVAEDPPEPRIAVHSEAHLDSFWLAAQVTAIAISDDGLRIAATYYQNARTRSGRDWRTFARTWDLETGEQTVIDHAAYPLVMSGDGRTLVMGLAERTEIRSYYADTRLAVWEFGKQEPARVLDHEIKVAVDGKTTQEKDRALPGSRQADREDVGAVPSVRAIALLRNNRVLAGYSDGSLRLWRTDGLSEDGSALLDERDADPSLSTVGGMITGVLWDGPRRPELVTLFPDPNAVNTIRRVELPVDQKLGLVKVLNDRFVQVETTAPDVDTIENALLSGHGTKEFGEMQRYTGPLRRELVNRIWPFVDMPELNSYRHAMVDKRGSWAAISARGRVWVVNGYGRVDHVVPFGGNRHSGGGVVGTNRNMQLLAVEDIDRSIRLWDVQAHRLVRTFAPYPNREDNRSSTGREKPDAETFTVAALQAHVEFGKTETNRERLVRDAKDASVLGARIIVLPEAAVTGYFDAAQNRAWHVAGHPLAEDLQGVELAGVAETVPGPSTEALSRVARMHAVYITVPLIEVDRRTGRYYNSVVLLGPDGQQLIHYRKHDPWSRAEESWASRGDLGVPVVDTPYGRLGILLSHDIDKYAKVMSEKKVDILLYPLAWMDESQSDWFEKRLPELAREHKMTIIAANWGVNRTVRDQPAPDWHGYGQSRIIASDGTILSQMTAGMNRSKTERLFADLPLPESLLLEK